VIEEASHRKPARGKTRFWWGKSLASRGNTNAMSVPPKSALISVEFAPVAQHRSVIVGQGRTELLCCRRWVVAIQEKAIIEP
jgi:hypothetical protein